MKREITFISKLAVVTFTIGVFTVSQLNAQTILPDIRVNSVDYSEITFDGGGNQMAVINDTVYIVWKAKASDSYEHVFFAKSVDGGSTFSNEVCVAEGSGSVINAFVSLSVSQSGVIHVTWEAFSNDWSESCLMYANSIDGGETFQNKSISTSSESLTSTPVYSSIGAYDDNVYIFYAEMANYPKCDYYFMRSENSGETFSNPIKINDQDCSGDIKFESLSYLFVDRTGKIYLAWVDGRRESGNGDIFFAKSTDSGQSFGPNVMVNDINMEGADSAQYMPCISTDDENTIFVSFTDLRLGNEWSKNRVFLAKSVDGGASFSTETLLADNDVTCKYHSINVTSSGELYAAVCACFPNDSWSTWLLKSTDQGDSFSAPISLSSVKSYDFSEVRLSSGNNDEIYSSWIDNKSGGDNYNIYFTKTASEITSVDHSVEKDRNISYNPTSGQISVSFSEGLEPVQLSVCNLSGQTLITKTMYKNADIDFNGHNTGIYLVTISSSNFKRTYKLVITR